MYIIRCWPFQKIKSKELKTPTQVSSIHLELIDRFNIFQKSYDFW